MYIRDFQERRKFERFLYSWVAVFAVVALLFALALGVAKLWSRERYLAGEIKELNLKIAEVKIASKTSLEKSNALKTSEGLEAEARGRFNLKMEGEELVIFLDEKPMEEEPKGFWRDAGESASQIWQNIKNWVGF